VDELAADEELWDRVRDTLPLFGVREAPAVDQLLALERGPMAAIGKRWFGVREPSGGIVCLGALICADGVGYIDNVATLPGWTAAGRASAVTARILQEALEAGAELVFLLAEPEGPVRMYERLGFTESTRIASTLSKRHAGGGM
jgi:N-acetylglutamate synthase-like GNAT family acetyltransferase